MKICVINTLYYPYQIGGAERSVQILAESLVLQGHDVVVVTLAEKAGVSSHNGVKIYSLSLSNIYWPFGAGRPSALKKLGWHALDVVNWFMASKVAKILDVEAPDVLHTNNLAGFSVLAWQEARLRSIPIVHTLRDYYLMCVSTTMFKGGVNCNRLCSSCSLFAYPKKKASEQVDLVVGISDFILSRHLDNGYFSNANKKVIHNSYDAVSETVNGRSTGSVTFGYIGRLAPSKGLELLVDTFENENIAGAKLLIAGSGDELYVQGLKNKVKNDCILFVGRSKPEDFFKAIDFLVVPSLWNEPLGRVVLEAYAFGIPVIASNIGALPEIVTDKKTGFLFDGKLGLGDALKSSAGMSLEEYLEMSGACSVESKRRFSSTSVANKYVSEYKKLAGHE